MSNSEMSNMERWLRIVCILTFIPSLPINIAHGAIAHTLLPALGLIPHAFSVGIAIHQLRLHEKCKGYRIRLEEEPPKKSKAFIGLLDLVSFLSLTTCIVLTFIILISQSSRWWWSGVIVGMIGAFGVMPFMVNSCIHFFFVARYTIQMVQLINKSTDHTGVCSHCPHCQTAPLLQESMVAADYESV